MQIGNPTASFTRPANTTAYAAGQMVANSITPASVVPMAFQLDNCFPMAQFRLTRARLLKSGTVITNATFRLNLYQVLPVVQAGSGDGSAYLTNGALNWLGNIDISSMVGSSGALSYFSDGSAGSGSCPAGSEIMLRAIAANGGAPPAIYGLLTALGAYTPISAEVFTVTLEVLEAY
jgi:hypothetical protein